MLILWSADSARAQIASGTDDGELEEVVVSGRRLPGSVVGDIQPETTLSSQEIRALGVGSVTELIAALGPQLNSSGGRGGRPVVLINGVRVSGFAEVRDLPTEAIQRVDIFPEEVALKYGYRADQRVMNIVLRSRFRAYTGDLSARGSTEGGREGANIGAGLLRIQRETRWQVDLKARHDDRLLESEREVVGADGAPRPDAASRTLLPASEALSANLVYAKPLREGLSATANLTLDDTRRRSLLGLRPAPEGPQVVRRDVDSLDSHLGGILQGAGAGWRWSASLNADRTDTATRVAGGDLAGRSRNDSLEVELLANSSTSRLSLRLRPARSPPATRVAVSVRSAFKDADQRQPAPAPCRMPPRCESRLSTSRRTTCGPSGAGRRPSSDRRRVSSSVRLAVADKPSRSGFAYTRFADSASEAGNSVRDAASGRGAPSAPTTSRSLSSSRSSCLALRSTCQRVSRWMRSRPAPIFAPSRPPSVDPRAERSPV